MKLSIITINRDNLKGLQATVESVLTQSTHDFEYIIIDGASTDGSVTLLDNIRERTGKFPVSSIFISEPDKGIYNAMNKGINLANGDYILFLNSGDCLVDEEVISKFINDNSQADVIAGKERFSSGKVHNPPTIKQLTYSYLMEWPLMHQSTFIKREAFRKYGLYNESYKIVSDWEWWLRALVIGNCSYDTLSFEVALFADNGVSQQNGPQWALHQHEIKCVNETILPRVYPLYQEVLRLRKANQEYTFLKKGKFGFIIKYILWIKHHL